MAFSYLTNVPLEQARRDYLRLLAERGFAPRAERVTCHRSELLALGFKPCMDCNP